MILCYHLFGKKTHINEGCVCGLCVCVCTALSVYSRVDQPWTDCLNCEDMRIFQKV